MRPTRLCQSATPGMIPHPRPSGQPDRRAPLSRLPLGGSAACASGAHRSPSSCHMEASDERAAPVSRRCPVEALRAASGHCHEGVTTLDRRNDRLSVRNSPRAAAVPSVRRRGDTGGPACAARAPFLDSGPRQQARHRPVAGSWVKPPRRLDRSRAPPPAKDDNRELRRAKPGVKDST
jgi:hypothetical protein